MFCQGNDEAEDEKRLSSMLMASTPVICIDNIERDVSGSFLNMMLTQEIVNARVLGSNNMPHLKTNSLILSTGNNIIFKGDMIRRVLSCNIDPVCERPDARSFKVNLRKWVPENRHLLIGAALTILRAYVLAGSPKQDIPSYGSFENWSDLVRSALVWLGAADPCLTRERVEDDDPIAGNLSAVLSLWYEAFKEEQLTTAQVISYCQEPIYLDLKNALLDVAQSNRAGDNIDSRRLGNWIKRNLKRVEAGYKFERSDGHTHGGVMLWRVVKINKVQPYSNKDGE